MFTSKSEIEFRDVCYKRTIQLFKKRRKKHFFSPTAWLEQEDIVSKGEPQRAHCTVNDTLYSNWVSINVNWLATHVPSVLRTVSNATDRSNFFKETLCNWRFWSFVKWFKCHVKTLKNLWNRTKYVIQLNVWFEWFFRFPPTPAVFPCDSQGLGALQLPLSKVGGRGTPTEYLQGRSEPRTLLVSYYHFPTKFCLFSQTWYNRGISILIQKRVI